MKIIQRLYAGGRRGRRRFSVLAAALLLAFAIHGLPAATAGAKDAKPVTRQDRIDFARSVFRDTDETWALVFKKLGKPYRSPVLVIFDGRKMSPCGLATSRKPPFYCPLNEKIYFDPVFFEELTGLMGKSSSFALATVIAHETGHHVQQLLGTFQKVSDEMARVGGVAANALSVKLELQADCYAGVWATAGDNRFHTIDPGDVVGALRAAKAFGDDALQRDKGEKVDPKEFRHGSGKQRMKWFLAGLDAGRIMACDTFAK